MKKLFIALLLLPGFLTFGQSFKQDLKKLEALNTKRAYWISKTGDADSFDATDSLSVVNDDFEKCLLKIATNYPESITAKFEMLKDSFVRILTSNDGNFRIYNWDTFEGGTMHFFKNIVQYKSGNKVKAKIYNTDDDDNGCSFYDLNQFSSHKKHVYMTCSVSIGSTAVYSYQAKAFAIDNGQLNENAKLFKTKSGLQNSIGYGIDFSNEANRADTYFRDHNLSQFEYMQMEYVPKTKTLIFPLLTEDEKLTVKKIKYKFNGTYFEKLKK